MSKQSRNFPHIYLPETGQSENYTRPRQGGGSNYPPDRDRAAHARYLEEQIGQAIQQANQILNSRDSQLATGVQGFYLEFQIKAEETIALKSLENRKKKIELVAVKKISDQEGMVLATVFVPESAQNYFLTKVEQYRDEDTKKDKPKNEALVARLEAVEIGTVRSLFTDNPARFPEDGQEVWWEVWLRKGKQEEFNQITRKLEIPTKPYAISFPEREVVLAMSNLEAMALTINNSDAVAELRIAKDTPSMFLEMGPLEQEQWVDDLEKRLLQPGKHAVSICVLDSGVTRIHPLLSPGLDAKDMHAVEPSWGVNDSGFWRGHGTAMAGLCLYSDQLIDLLATSEKVKILHRIESVKILPNTGPNEPELYGAITGQGVSLPEIQAPDRRRVFLYGGNK
jgi:hypothetical protein